VTILEGCASISCRTCRPCAREPLTNMLSNSAKIVNIIGAHRFNAILRRTADCVEIACSGS